MMRRPNPSPERVPQSDHILDGPTYQGRPLARVDDEVVDQGIAFDLATLMTRRSVIGLLGMGAGALALAACTTGPDPAPRVGFDESGQETPEEIAGPFPGDGSNGVNVLDRSGIVRSDIRSSIEGGSTAAGVPLTITLTVLDTADDERPLRDAAVYVWQCDARGGYSMYSSGLEDETYLRGVQQVDASGMVTFTSIFPGCYPGRWPHVHFEVYARLDSVTSSVDPIITSQLAFPERVSRDVYSQGGYGNSLANLDGVTLGSDIVFRDDSAALQMADVTGNASAGLEAALTVRVSTP